MSIKNLIIRKGQTPSDPFTSVAQEVDRLFGDLALGLTEWPFGRANIADNSRFLPAVDVENDEKHLRLSAELPGMDEKDVQVTMQDGVLTMRGEKKAAREENSKGAFRVERSYGMFERRFALPDDVDASKAEATFKKGVLTVTIPKMEKPQPEVKQIPIKGE